MNRIETDPEWERATYTANNLRQALQKDLDAIVAGVQRVAKEGATAAEAYLDRADRIAESAEYGRQLGELLEEKSKLALERYKLPAGEERDQIDSMWSYPVSVDGVGLAVKFSVC